VTHEMILSDKMQSVIYCAALCMNRYVLLNAHGYIASRCGCARSAKRIRNPKTFSLCDIAEITDLFSR